MKLTPISTQSSPLNLGMYWSPRATSALFSGLKRHTTLMVHSAAASPILAAVDGLDGWMKRSENKNVVLLKLSVAQFRDFPRKMKSKVKTVKHTIICVSIQHFSVKADNKSLIEEN